MRARWLAVATLGLVASIAVPAWWRGAQPDLGPAPAGAEETAARLLEAGKAVLDGEVDSGPALPGWYLTAWSAEDGEPVTVAATGDWRDLRRAASGHLQVDLALSDPPPFRAGPSGFGLDVGLDGAITREGRVLLPVEPLVRGWSRRELKRFLDENPARPLRTWAWVPADGGATRLLRGTVDPGPLTPVLLRARARLGGDYLARHLNEDGRFDYEWSARDGVAKKGYNLLRHGGTAYALFQVYLVTGDPRHYAAGAAAVGWLRGQTVRSRLDPERCMPVEGGKAKLGGAALMLLALVEQAAARPEDMDRETIRCLGEHVASLVAEDGEPSTYASEGGRFHDSNFRSSYYPGEALLALGRLVEIWPEPAWQAALDRLARWIVHRQWTGLGLRIRVLADAWQVQGLEHLHRRTGRADQAAHAFAIAERTLAWGLRGPGIPPDLRGGPWGRALPNVVANGSRTEGLAAAARLARRVRPGEDEYRRNLELLVAFGLRNQYTEPMVVGLVRPEEALGGYRSRPDDPVVRIDAVQHNLSGLLGLLELMEAP